MDWICMHWSDLYYASSLDLSWKDYLVGSVQLGHRHNKLVTWVVQDLDRKNAIQRAREAKGWTVFHLPSSPGR